MRAGGEPEWDCLGRIQPHALDLARKWEKKRKEKREWACLVLVETYRVFEKDFKIPFLENVHHART